MKTKLLLLIIFIFIGYGNLQKTYCQPVSAQKQYEDKKNKLKENVPAKVQFTTKPTTAQEKYKSTIVILKPNIPDNTGKRYETISISDVKKYAPILHIDPREGQQCCYPSNAEDAYPRACRGQTGEHKVPKSLNPIPPCYYEAFYTIDGYRIKYWFWYNYNDYATDPLDCCGSHSGDWEYVIVFIKNNSLYQVQFSKHSAEDAYVKYPSELTFSGTHVNVWAANGSHANYYSPNPANLYSKFGFSDEVMAGGDEWQTWNNLVYVRNTNFKDYCGDWADGKGTYGPACRTQE